MYTPSDEQKITDAVLRKGERKKSGLFVGTGDKNG